MDDINASTVKKNGDAVMADYSREYGVSAPVKTKGRSRVDDEETREKQSRAVELRRAGASFSEIASALGYHDQSGAKKAVEAAIRRHEFEATKDLLRLDLARLDEWMKLCTHRVRTAGDLTQIDRMMRIMEKKHWMLGVTPASLAEENADGTSTTKGGMNVVIASTERTFVRGMMLAVGQDPDSPEGRAYLAARGLGEEKELTSGDETPANAEPGTDVPLKTKSRRVKKSGGSGSSSSPAPARVLKKKKRKVETTTQEVIEAEIVDPDEDVRSSALAISVRKTDEDELKSGIQVLKEVQI